MVFYGTRRNWEETLEQEETVKIKGNNPVVLSDNMDLQEERSGFSSNERN